MDFSLMMLKDNLMIVSSRGKKSLWVSYIFLCVLLSYGFLTSSCNDLLALPKGVCPNLLEDLRGLLGREDHPCKLVDDVTPTFAPSLPVSTEYPEWLFKHMHHIISFICFKIFSTFCFFVCFLLNIKFNSTHIYKVSHIFFLLFQSHLPPIFTRCTEALYTVVYFLLIKNK